MFLQKLIQRNKARKEFINETKMEIPLLGKKRSALVDEQQIYSSMISNVLSILYNLSIRIFTQLNFN